MIIKESVKIGDKVVSIETGRVAKQAQGSVIIRSGDTVVLCTVCGAKEAKPFQNFLPLTVDYIEKTYAAGKIPGGFFKREGRLRDHEVLTSRLIDRPCRPLFPDGYRNEIQVIATVLSADGENLSDVLAMIGCAAALAQSPIPWAGPIAGVRVGRVDGEVRRQPDRLRARGERLRADHRAPARTRSSWSRASADEMSEDDLIEAIFFGHEAVQGDARAHREAPRGRRRREVGATSRPSLRLRDPPRASRKSASTGIKEACNIAEKHARYGKFKPT